MPRWVHRRDDERGETLAELLVTISIMGILFAAVLGAIAVSAQTSDISHKEAGDETLLRSAAEQVQAATYVTCASTSSYAVSSLPGYTVSITAVRYWNGDNPATFAATLATCPGTDQGVQAVDLKAQSTDGRATETLTVYKRVS